MTAVLLHLNRPLMILVNPPEYLPYCLDSITILPEKMWTYFFVKPCHVNNIIMQMHTLYGKYGIFYRNFQKSQNTTNQYKSPGKRQHFLIGFQSALGAQSEQTSLLQFFLTVQTGSVTKFSFHPTLISRFCEILAFYINFFALTLSCI